MCVCRWYLYVAIATRYLYLSPLARAVCVFVWMCVSISLSRLHTHAAEGEEANNRVSVPSLSLCPHPSTTTPTKTHPHSVPPGTHRQSPVSVLSLLSYKARRPSRRRWRDGGRVTYQSLLRISSPSLSRAITLLLASARRRLAGASSLSSLSRARATHTQWSRSRTCR